MRNPRVLLAAGFLMLVGPAVSAHTVIVTREATAGSYYKAVFRVPHGCQGSATTGLRVEIPESVMSVRPQPKQGWSLAVERTPLAAPKAGPHGSTVTERVGIVAWTGGHLEDAHFDEFAVLMKLPDLPGTVLYFPVVQGCKAGDQRWTEVPEPGVAAAGLEHPAPALTLTASL